MPVIAFAASVWADALWVYHLHNHLRICLDRAMGRNMKMSTKCNHMYQQWCGCALRHWPPHCHCAPTCLKAMCHYISRLGPDAHGLPRAPVLLRGHWPAGGHVGPTQAPPGGQAGLPLQEVSTCMVKCVREAYAGEDCLELSRSLTMALGWIQSIGSQGGVTTG